MMKSGKKTHNKHQKPKDTHLFYLPDRRRGTSALGLAHRQVQAEPAQLRKNSIDAVNAPFVFLLPGRRVCNEIKFVRKREGVGVGVEGGGGRGGEGVYRRKFNCNRDISSILSVSPTQLRTKVVSLHGGCRCDRPVVAILSGG